MTPEGLPLEQDPLSVLLDLKRGYVLLLRAINLVNYSRCKQPLTWATPSPAAAAGGGGGASFWLMKSHESLPAACCPLPGLHPATHTSPDVQPCSNDLLIKGL